MVVVCIGVLIEGVFSEEETSSKFANGRAWRGRKAQWSWVYIVAMAPGKRLLVLVMAGDKWNSVKYLSRFRLLTFLSPASSPFRVISK